jgi:hypothetical protein
MSEPSFGDVVESILRTDFSARPGKTSDGPSPFGDRLGESRPTMGGTQWLFKFANRYGASVIRLTGSYGSDDGLWELAVIGQDGHLTYDTPITDDVIGWLDETAVASLLEQIEALPPVKLIGQRNREDVTERGSE